MIRYILVIFLVLLTNNAYSLSKVDGKNIILLTAKERKLYDDKLLVDYENITLERAKDFCKNIGQVLTTYKFEEVYCDYVHPTQSTSECSKKLINSVIPFNGGFRTPSPEELETHYHRGGATVAVLTLGLVPIIIPYKTRIVTEINCVKGKQTYKVE